MKLLPISLDHVQLQESLPFDLLTANGLLLLPAHRRVESASALARLQGHGQVYGPARDVEAWRRGLAYAVHKAVRRNVPLLHLARARPEPLYGEQGVVMPGQEWSDLAWRLNAALQEPGSGPGWIERVQEVHARMHVLAMHRFDEALFHFIHHGACNTYLYSSHQALRCMLIASETARRLAWEPERIELLDQAALLMNVASWRLQNQLARHDGVLDPRVRAELERHPDAGAQLLERGGVSEPVCLDAVRLHHDASLDARPDDELSTGERLAVLLRRVDIYCARLSRRAGRGALSALQAASHVCLGPDGKPDAIGAAMLKAVGLYPPGTFVKLASEESAIVLARGERANQPLAVALSDAQGQSLQEPRLRDTAEPDYAVRAALRPDQMPVDPPMAKLLALRVANDERVRLASAA